MDTCRGRTPMSKKVKVNHMQAYTAEAVWDTSRGVGCWNQRSLLWEGQRRSESAPQIINRSEIGCWPYGRFLIPSALLFFKTMENQRQGFMYFHMFVYAQKRRTWLICIPITNHSLATSAHFPSSPPLLSMWSPKSLPSILLFQQRLQRVTFMWNLASYWIFACTGESARLNSQIRWRLSEYNFLFTILSSKKLWLPCMSL